MGMKGKTNMKSHRECPGSRVTNPQSVWEKIRVKLSSEGMAIFLSKMYDFMISV